MTLSDNAKIFTISSYVPFKEVWRAQQTTSDFLYWQLEGPCDARDLTSQPIQMFQSPRGQIGHSPNYTSKSLTRKGLFLLKELWNEDTQHRHKWKTLNRNQNIISADKAVLECLCRMMSEHSIMTFTPSLWGLRLICYPFQLIEAGFPQHSCCPHVVTTLNPNILICSLE